MYKKVKLTNNYSEKSINVIVKSDDDDDAVIGSGKTSVESADISNVDAISSAIIGFTKNKQAMISEDRLSLFSGLAKCLDRNLPLIKSFYLQTNRMRTPLVRGMIPKITREISQGEKISVAMSNQKGLLRDDTIALVKAGEESGRLPEIFNRITNSQKNASRIIKKIKGGLIYPAIVMVIVLAVILIMNFTLIPSMSKLYKSMGAELPFATKILVQSSNILLNYPWLVAIPIVGLAMFFKNWGKISSTDSVQKFFLKIPVVSELVRKSTCVVSFRTLALLLDANIRMSTSLDITADSTWHCVYREFFKKVKGHIQEGTSLTDSFLIESHHLGFDGRLICGLMETASETGSGTELLDEIADDYEEELELMANKIDKLIEPFTMMVLGVLVGGVVFAIYGPMFSLGDVVLKK